MYKCCSCKKEFDSCDQDLCDCGGGIVFYMSEYDEIWSSEYDSGGF